MIYIPPKELDDYMHNPLNWCLISQFLPINHGSKHTSWRVHVIVPMELHHAFLSWLKWQYVLPTGHNETQIYYPTISPNYFPQFFPKIPKSWQIPDLFRRFWPSHPTTHHVSREIWCNGWHSTARSVTDSCRLPGRYVYPLVASWQWTIAKKKTGVHGKINYNYKWRIVDVNQTWIAGRSTI